MIATALKAVAAALAVGALTVVGAGTASAATTAPAITPAPATQPWHGDYCDSYQHRWDRACYSNTRWYWHNDGRGHGHWDQWRYDQRDHRWGHRDGDHR